MLGTKVKCPGLVRNVMGEDVICAHERYTILKAGVFRNQPGVDPLAAKVRCHRCNHIYYVFPAINYTVERIGEVKL